MNGVDRSGARRLMRIGQAAALLLAGGAVLALTVRPGLPAAPAVASGERPPETPTDPSAEPVPLDVGMVSTVLNEAGAVTPRFPDQTPPVAEVIEPRPDVTTDPERTTSNFRFLGGFFSPSRSLAIIAGAGKQRMAREGDVIDFGFTVNTITEDFVEIERNGVVERLDREIARGAVVATAVPDPGMSAPPDRLSPGTAVGETARDRLRIAREQAAQRAGSDRAKMRADYERQRQQRIEELREQGVDVDDLEWRQDD